VDWIIQSNNNSLAAGPRIVIKHPKWEGVSLAAAYQFRMKRPAVDRFDRIVRTYLLVNF
jgi:hypothetical protein